eukprot:TRINITY_DN71923_c0_g1_i1.p1 TRINITY_DN71923_c0_g1~~TRINITY_DN71923_c0_g1_i1.p1  ORF type:complete len:303 (+),score=115.58 TRINITY_DN71923_c0_g1_i1:90-911(+)
MAAGDIAARAPVLVPDKGAAQEQPGPDRTLNVAARQDQRIRDLEETIKRCDKVLAKQARADRRVRRKLVKHIDDEEEKALIDRMYYNEQQRRQEREEQFAKERAEAAPPLAKSTPTRLGGSYSIGGRLRNFIGDYASRDVVARNYEDALEKRRKERSDLAERVLPHPEKPPKTLDPGDVSEMAERLCTREMDERGKRLEQLLEKYGASPKARSPRRLDKATLAESTQRLHAKSVEHKQGTIAALRALYSPEPERRVLTKQQMLASASRLYGAG